MVLLENVRVNSKFFSPVGKWICVDVDRENDSILAILEKDFELNGQNAVAHRYNQDHLDGFAWTWDEAKSYWHSINPKYYK